MFKLAALKRLDVVRSNASSISHKSLNCGNHGLEERNGSAKGKFSVQDENGPGYTDYLV